MRNILLISVFVITHISCNSNKEQISKKLDLEEFTIQIPQTWNYVKHQGYDSFVGEIKINDQESITFDLGMYSNQLYVDSLSHEINFTTINYKQAKMVRPRKVGQGITGIYIDSIELTKTTKFQMSGNNLKAENQQLFLNAIETLKFKN